MARASCVLVLLVSAAAAAQIPSTFLISGRVLDHTGAPRAGARVCAARIDLSPPSGSTCTTSGATGGFAIPGTRSRSIPASADDPIDLKAPC